MEKFKLRVNYIKDYSIIYVVECEDLAEIIIMAKNLSINEDVENISVTNLKNGIIWNYKNRNLYWP